MNRRGWHFDIMLDIRVIISEMRLSLLLNETTKAMGRIPTYSGVGKHKSQSEFNGMKEQS